MDFILKKKVDECLIHKYKIITTYNLHMYIQNIANTRNYHKITVVR